MEKTGSRPIDDVLAGIEAIADGGHEPNQMVVENQIEIGYRAFLFVIQQKHGALPEGVVRWLRAAYFSGARGAFVLTSEIAKMLPDEQQKTVDAIVRELTEAAL